MNTLCQCALAAVLGMLSLAACVEKEGPMELTGVARDHTTYFGSISNGTIE